MGHGRVNPRLRALRDPRTRGAASLALALAAAKPTFVGWDAGVTQAAKAAFAAERP